MQIYYMKKEKVSIPVATVILMIVTITYKFVLVAIGVGIAVFGRGFLHQYLEGILPVFYLGLGFLVAVVCALSGAGGPILLMPILVTLGLGVHQAIGVALFDSIFIALPSVAGYALRSSMGEIWPVLAVSCAALAVGVLVGSRSAHRIRQQPLKISVAVFSVAISLYMIAKLFV